MRVLNLCTWQYTHTCFAGCAVPQDAQTISRQEIKKSNYRSSNINGYACLGIPSPNQAVTEQGSLSSIVSVVVVVSLILQPDLTKHFETVSTDVIEEGAFGLLGAAKTS